MRKLPGGIASFLLTVAFAAMPYSEGFAGPPGESSGGAGSGVVIYVVSRGDTLWALSRAYGVGVREILKLNPLKNPNRIFPGQRLRIPARAARRENDRMRSRGELGTRSQTRSVAMGSRAVGSRGGAGIHLSWPAAGKLTSRFGWRWGRMHEGIDLAASTGTDVFAAAPGKVAFTGWRSGYGQLVIVDHGNGVETYYGHNSKILVQEGEYVNRMGLLGEIGRTGRSTGSHLHFEVRVDGKAVNPLKFLP